MSEPPESRVGRGWTIFFYLLPVALPAMLALIYFLSPDLYLRYILELRRREFQFVELTTEALAFAAGVMLLVAGRRAWRAATADRLAGRILVRRGAAGWLDGRGGAALIFIIAAGALFLALEEISWGQKFFKWDSGGLRETNVHNTVPISVPGLGSIVLVLLLIGIPLAWRWRGRLPVPRDWAPAVAEGPVVLCLIAAFAMSWIKDAARAIIEDESASTVYMQYFEQVNEQKEMLIALALFVYGVYRLKAARPRVDA